VKVCQAVVVYRARLAASYQHSSLADCWTITGQYSRHIQRMPWWIFSKCYWRTDLFTYLRVDHQEAQKERGHRTATAVYSKNLLDGQLLWQGSYE